MPINILEVQKSKNQVKYDEGKSLPRFDFEQFPVGYFADNARAKALRSQLVKNQIATNENELGTLEKGFFSSENVDIINRKLILAVFTKSNKEFLICPQKEENLIIVMRYVWIEYSRNLPFNIKEQIEELNCRVVGEILPTVISNADQKTGYYRDISTQPIGPPLPVNTKNIQRTLPSISNVLDLTYTTKGGKLDYENPAPGPSNIQGFPGLDSTFTY